MTIPFSFRCLFQNGIRSGGGEPSRVPRSSLSFSGEFIGTRNVDLREKERERNVEHGRVFERGFETDSPDPYEARVYDVDLPYTCYFQFFVFLKSFAFMNEMSYGTI